MANDPILHLLGLAKKAGRLEIGEEPVGAVCRARQARLVLLAADAASNTYRRAAHFGEVGNVLWLELPFTKEELGFQLGRSSCAMLALTDAGFAAAVSEKLRARDPEKYEAAAREKFFAVPYDYIVDCIDLVSCKLDLIETALTRGVPIVSALGTGNKLDPAQFRISDLSQTQGCPLARVVRRELRARGILHHRVLWSPEPPREPLPAEAPPPGRRAVPGSVAWVPPVAGLMLAGDVALSLAGLRA